MNTIIRKIKGHESAQVRVRLNNDANGVTKSIDLISYTTRVVTVNLSGELRIECTGTYSRTTIKHIGWFLREYMPKLSYYAMKAIAGKGVCIVCVNDAGKVTDLYDSETGEVYWMAA